MRSLLSIDPQTLAGVTGGNNDNGNVDTGGCDAASARIHDLPTAPPAPLIADPKRPDITGPARRGPRFE
jgi:hypothetical protein